MQTIGTGPPAIGFQVTAESAAAQESWCWAAVQGDTRFPFGGARQPEEDGVSGEAWPMGRTTGFPRAAGDAKLTRPDQNSGGPEREDLCVPVGAWCFATG